MKQSGIGELLGITERSNAVYSKERVSDISSLCYAR